jgi:hypothetical protein
MAKLYIYKKADDSWSDPHALWRVMEAAERHIRQGAGPFVINADGDPVAQDLTRQEALDRLRSVMKNRPVGNTYRTRNRNGDVVFTSRAVNRAPLDNDTTNGNDKADRLWNWINAEYKRFDPRFAGAYVCKSIATSGTLSQHSYGNALDVFFDSLSHQDEVADAVVANRQLLGPFHVISKDRIWTKDVGWHDYVGEYHRHLHVDFDPQLTGPCGVKP